MGTNGEVSLEIPIIQDLKGKTALDYCLGEQRPQRDWCKQVFKRYEPGQTMMNLGMAQVIFQ